MSTTSTRLDSFVDNPRRALWSMALPVMAGMALQTGYLLADMMFVGRLSADALTAVSFNVPLVFLGMGISFGLGGGVSAVVARHVGARNQAVANRAAENGLVIGIALTVLFSISGWLWGRNLLRVMGVPEPLLPLAWQYARVIFAGYGLFVMSVFFRSTLTGEGDMKTPMKIQLIGTTLNLVLDPIFIFTLGLGVTGAALATVVAQGFVALALVYMLFVKRDTFVTFSRADFRFDPHMIARICRVGGPSSFSFLVVALGGAIFNRVLVGYSGAAVAVYQVGNRIDQVVMLPMFAISNSLVTLTGMLSGARRADLLRGVVGYSISRLLALSALVGALFYVGAPWIFRLFTEDAVILETGTTYLRIVCWGYPFIVLPMVAGRVLQGLGQGTPVLILTVLRVGLVGGPLALAFVYVWHKPLTWVWWALVSGVVASTAARGTMVTAGPASG